MHAALHHAKPTAGLHPSLGPMSNAHMTEAVDRLCQLLLSRKPCIWALEKRANLLSGVMQLALCNGVLWNHCQPTLAYLMNNQMARRNKVCGLRLHLSSGAVAGHRPSFSLPLFCSPRIQGRLTMVDSSTPIHLSRGDQ